MNKFCGLDFGTSNSTVGLKKNTGFALANLEGDSPIIPSAIFFDKEEHVKLFGKKAIEKYIEGQDGRLMQSIKSILGSDLMHKGTFVIDKKVKFQDIIGYLIAHLKVQAENQLEGSIDSVVMGRPVHFNDHDSAKDHEAEELLKTIAQNQGFKNVEFQFEPIAAALAYEQKSVTKETLALVADIGGGTSDFSVIKLGSNNFDRKQDILANAGIHIGGTDFDRKISVKEVMPFFGANSEIKDMSGKSLKVPKAFFSDMATWHRINSLYCDEVKESIAGYIKNAPNSASLGRFQTLIEYEFGHLLNTRIEQQKQILSSKTQSVLDLGFIEKGLTLPLLQEKSNEAILEEITKLSNITNEILMQAGVAASDIDVIFFTGGSTKIPILREYIFNNIPKAEVVEGDAFGSVGYGLAVDAEKRFR